MHDEIIAEFNNAIEINPKHARAYYNRGLTYAKKASTTRPSLTTAEPLRLILISKRPMVADQKHILQPNYLIKPGRMYIKQRH